MQCRRITSGANKCSVELCCVHCSELCLVHPEVGSTIAQQCIVVLCIVLCSLHPGVGSTVVHCCIVVLFCVLCILELVPQK